MALSYDENFSVFQFECDPWDRMTPGAMLRRIQEISTQQCENLGLNTEIYKKTNTLFLLSRISLEIYTPPVIGQNVRIQTRAYGMERAIFQRVTTLYDKKDKKLCEADSRWVLVNTATKHILRKLPEGFPAVFTDAQGAEAHEMNMPKIKDVAMAAKQVAGYTLCDRNGHINNTRYADIVCDVIPLEQIKQKAVSKMLLHYRSEIPMGEEFEVFSACPAENQYYHIGRSGGHKSFEVLTTF